MTDHTEKEEQSEKDMSETLPECETIVLQLGVVAIHLVVTIAALIIVAALVDAELSGRGPGRLMFWSLLAPPFLSGVFFRWRVHARPTVGFTSRTAIFFTVTNFACGMVMVNHRPQLLNELPPLVPIQWWGLMIGLAASSWLLSVVFFHIGTRGCWVRKVTKPD